jgi:hypothetical protein
MILFPIARRRFLLDNELSIRLDHKKYPLGHFTLQSLRCDHTGVAHDRVVNSVNCSSVMVDRALRCLAERGETVEFLHRLASRAQCRQG